MRFFLDRKGSVTPFFAIVLAAMVFLNFAFYDALRQQVLKKETERRTEFSAASALAMFDRMLEERYGLYCLRDDEREEVENRCCEMADNVESLTEMLADGFTRPENGVELNVMNYDVIGNEIELTASLDDLNVLLNEITELMKYKSVANGAEKAAEKIAEMGAAAEKYDEIKSEKEMNELCENFKILKQELENKTELVNSYFDSLYANGSELLKNAVSEKLLPDTVSYDENAANILKNALKLYGEGVFIYGDICREALEKTEQIIKFQEDASEKVNRTEEKLRRLGMTSQAVKRVKREVTDENFLYTETVISGNYRRLQQAENSYNKFIKSVKTGEVLNIQLFENAIKDIDAAYGKYEKVNYSSGIKAIADTSNYSYGEPIDKAKAAGDFFAFCRNEIPESIYEELPSKGDNSSSGLDNFENAENIAEVFGNAVDSVKDSFFINDYIKTYFLSADEIKMLNEHYLRGEKEYIVCGKRTDSENIKTVYAEILAIRTLMNVSHILMDEKKTDEVRLMAEAVSVATYGAGKEVYEAVIILGWSAAEGVNDMKRLEKGESVPLVKSREDWALSIDGEAKADNQEKKNVSGMKYGNYVDLLLDFVPKETKLKRIQDLVELNMYKKTNKYTKVSELFTGIKIKNAYRMKTYVLTDKNGKHKYEWEMKDEKNY